MQSTDQARVARVSVVFERRADGGLRVYSDDVPGFVLSSDDQSLVLEDVVPALEVIISEMVGRTVRVYLLEPWQKFQQGEQFVPRIEHERQSIDYVAAAA